MKREQQSVQHAQVMGVQDSECDNPHERVRAPMVEVESYSRLVEAIPSLELDFFRSPIPEEEKKQNVGNVTKIESAAKSVVRKAKAKIYNHAVALSVCKHAVKTEAKLPNHDILASKKIPTKNRIRNRNRSPFCPRQQTAFGTASAAAHTTQNAAYLQQIQQITPRRITAKKFQIKEKKQALSRATNFFSRRRTTRYDSSSLGQTHSQ
ncbi:hypothetical protein BB561_006225 [Smittium simulii]|uniref:Uncharacterized protein n=1 Tax=Smittium simulii TaxID=133385 RepID=A0A2T9Y5S2_9FUNG|nr:hypothetical protein BB561_006225 [Smittium simulii]